MDYKAVLIFLKKRPDCHVVHQRGGEHMEGGRRVRCSQGRSSLSQQCKIQDQPASQVRGSRAAQSR